MLFWRHCGGCRTHGTSYYSSTSSLVHGELSGCCIDFWQMPSCWFAYSRAFFLVVTCLYWCKSCWCSGHNNLNFKLCIQHCYCHTQSRLLCGAVRLQTRWVTVNSLMWLQLIYRKHVVQLHLSCSVVKHQRKRGNSEDAETVFWSMRMRFCAHIILLLDAFFWLLQQTETMNRVLLPPARTWHTNTQCQKKIHKCKYGCVYCASYWTRGSPYWRRIS